MILIDFLAMVLLYAVYKLTQNKVEDKPDQLGMLMVYVLILFGGLFLVIDLIDKIAGLF